MVLTCCAYNCKVVAGEGYSLHKFPQDKDIKAAWILAIRRKNFTPSPHARLCSKHFTPDSYGHLPYGLPLLKKTAIPTIFDYPGNDEERNRLLLPRNNDYISCFIPGCQSECPADTEYSLSIGERIIHMFPAPRTDRLFEKWKKALEKMKKEFTKEDHVCELHFHEQEIERFYVTKTSGGSIIEVEKTRPSLINTAVPSLFLDSSPSKDSEPTLSVVQNSGTENSEECEVDELDIPPLSFNDPPASVTKYTLKKLPTAQKTVTENPEKNKMDDLSIASLCSNDPSDFVMKDTVTPIPVAKYRLKKLHKAHKTVTANSEKSKMDESGIASLSSNDPPASVMKDTVELPVTKYHLKRLPATQKEMTADAEKSNMDESSIASLGSNNPLASVMKDIVKELPVMNEMAAENSKKSKLDTLNISTVSPSDSVAPVAKKSFKKLHAVQNPVNSKKRKIDYQAFFKHSSIPALSSSDSEDDIIGTFYDSTADSTIDSVQEQIPPVKKCSTYQDLVKNLQHIKRPSNYWSVVCTDEFVIFAKWNDKFAVEKRIVIESSFTVRVFLKEWEITITDLMDINSVDDISALLEKVESYSLNITCS